MHSSHPPSHCADQQADAAQVEGAGSGPTPSPHWALVTRRICAQLSWLGERVGRNETDLPNVAWQALAGVLELRIPPPQSPALHGLLRDLGYAQETAARARAQILLDAGTSLMSRRPVSDPGNSS